MTTLWELDKSIQQVIDTGFAYDEETGEVYFDESDLEDLQLAYQQKAENTALYIKDKQALVEAIKEEEKALRARRKALEGQVDSLKQYLAMHWERMPENGLETARAKVSVRKSQKVEVIDRDAIPDEYMRVKVTEEPDKQKIAKAIKDGEAVPGAALVKENHVQIK